MVDGTKSALDHILDPRDWIASVTSPPRFSCSGVHSDLLANARYELERLRSKVVELERRNANQVMDYKCVDDANRQRHIELYEMEMRARRAEQQLAALSLPALGERGET